MDITHIKNSLDNCLINDYWDNPNKFQQLNDPFPKWFQEEVEN